MKYEKPEDEKAARDRDPSIEYERIIRNMLGYDSAEEMINEAAQDHTRDDFESFVDEILEKIDIDLRTETEFLLPDGKDAKTWLQKTFTAINKGKAERVCLPAQIDVLLDPDDIAFELPEFISEVIDTRGYDGRAREDLREYLSEPDTICLVLDDVNALPGEMQRRILSEWVDKEQKDTIDRVFLLVKDKNGALADVNDADGDPEKGERIKLSELKRKIKSESLNYRLENTLFVDSYEGIEHQKQPAGGRKHRKIVTYFDPSIRDSERERITAHLARIIAHHRQALSEEAEHLEEDIKQRVEVLSTPAKSRAFDAKQREITAKITALSDTMQREITELFEDSNPALKDFEELFWWDHFKIRSDIKWNSARAMVNRKGVFYNANAYYEYAAFCEKNFKGKCASKKQQILDYIKELGECEATPEDILSYIRWCKTIVDTAYEQMIKNVRSLAGSCCREALTETYWQRARNVERGSGYYANLLNMLEKQMGKTDLGETTAKAFKQEIIDFTDKVNNALTSKPSAM
ncbi:MAG: hypothetical protein K5695_00310 [Oscillospiraceae bacterium]|nr:hypothetical protein [Oscillospiraceae bacterium]